MALRRLGIIPCRMGSQRFPGKPLAQIQGVSMIEWVYRSASRSQLLEQVWIATEDEEIQSAAATFGANCVMTSDRCATGTDRVRECLDRLELPISDDTTVVNVQGDEPLVSPAHIDAVVRCLEEDDGASVSTAVVEEDDPDMFCDPNVVKVVKDEMDRALYFSRAPIPFQAGSAWDEPLAFLRHVGLYAFKASFLRDTFGSLKESGLERREQLEQLRVMEAGFAIRAVTVDGPAFPGIDTLKQLEELERFLRQNPEYGAFLTSRR